MSGEPSTWETFLGLLLMASSVRLEAVRFSWFDDWRDLSIPAGTSILAPSLILRELDNPDDAVVKAVCDRMECAGHDVLLLSLEEQAWVYTLCTQLKVGGSSVEARNARRLFAIAQLFESGLDPNFIEEIFQPDRGQFDQAMHSFVASLQGSPAGACRLDMVQKFVHDHQLVA